MIIYYDNNMIILKINNKLIKMINIICFLNFGEKMINITCFLNFLYL